MIGTMIFVSMDLPDICLAVRSFPLPLPFLCLSLIVRADVSALEMERNLVLEMSQLPRFAKNFGNLFRFLPHRLAVRPPNIPLSLPSALMTDSIRSNGKLSYMRHYLNLKILYSVWNEFELIPYLWRSYDSNVRGWWLFGGGIGTGEVPPWMK